MSKDKVTIQQKMKRLDEIVEWFESDEFQLEQASEKLKQAAALATEIEHDLNTVANEVRIVKQSFVSETE